MPHSGKFVLGAPPLAPVPSGTPIGGSLYPNMKTAIPHGITLFTPSLSGRSLRGPLQRQLRASAAGGFGPRDSTSRKNTAHSSLLRCSLPAVSATSPDKLQSAAWGGGELRGSASRKSNNPFTSPILSGSGCALPGWAERPSAQARRLVEPQRYDQKQSPKHRPNPSPLLGPARLDNRSRFSSPKNKHSPIHGPKQSPVLRPVSASLRLRSRSAAFSRALRDSSIFGSPPK